MRLWFFHPLIFYPLAILLAGLLIAASVQPQRWDRAPAPVAAELAENALVYAGPAFDSPAPAPEQYTTVMRDLFGRAQTLRVAIKPNNPGPTPTEQGVRILMTAHDAARVENREVVVEVSYNPSPVNAATALAVSLQGSGAPVWRSQALPPEPGAVRFTLPAQAGVNAIGLRAISNGSDQAYAVEITRIRVIPRA
jgi:hypothetical protein